MRPGKLGTGIGLIGMMQNFGKGIGPVLGGLAFQTFGYEPTLLLLSVMLIIGMFIIWQVFALRSWLSLQKFWPDSESRVGPASP